MRKLYKLIIQLIFILAVSFSFAEKTPVKNLSSYKLENGLELYVMENHSAPLVYIEIAVKAGGIAQKKEDAGLFHLYEHMMFKGNTKYQNAASVQKAINDMGVASWNGSTGTECVNYFFTIPSDLLYTGLEFWSYAVCEPLLKKDELENEKKVVLSEIQGNVSDPSRILISAQSILLFPDAPWKLDPAGSAENVQNATVEDLKSIQQKYYVPNNAALFVGGDVDPEDVYKKVSELYGGWKKSSDPYEEKTPEQNTAPFSKTEYRVMPYDQCSPQIAQIQVDFRGPDTSYDIQSTYPADVIGKLFQNPSGFYKTTLISNKDLQIPNADYVWGGYSTSASSGIVDFGAVVLSPEQLLPQRAKLFESSIQTGVVQKILSDENIFPKEMLTGLYNTLKDDRLYESETAKKLLTTLRFFWIVDDVDYYYSYNDELSKVTWNEMSSFLTKYVDGKHPLVTVLVNPQVYEAQKQTFADEGFVEITADDAFWWNKKTESTEGESK